MRLWRKGLRKFTFQERFSKRNYQNHQYGLVNIGWWSKVFSSHKVDIKIQFRTLAYPWLSSRYKVFDMIFFFFFDLSFDMGINPQRLKILLLKKATIREVLVCNGNEKHSLPRLCNSWNHTRGLERLFFSWEDWCEGILRWHDKIASLFIEIL